MNRLPASLAGITAIFIKETVQMRRDRLTFGMMFGIPIVQLILFGYAINTDPRLLPSALVVEEQTPIVRTLVEAFERSGYFDFVEQSADPLASADMLARGEVAFVLTIPSGFTRALVRGEHPSILLEADASDPSASSNALGHAEQIIRRALRHELRGPLLRQAPQPGPVELRVHRSYNPEGITAYNIVPGLLGVILTMTLIMITAIAMTREVERGTMENLLAMPVRPAGVMLGKILPYVVVGAMQTLVILLAAHFLFAVPFSGSLWLLLGGVAIFVVANLALGFTFSTIANSQMAAMQLTFFFFLPSLLLSGFMFPFRGMPHWAQFLGEAFPLTHFLRLVRGVMLKDASLQQMQGPLLAMLAFTVIAVAVALLRFRRTLD